MSVNFVHILRNCFEFLQKVFLVLMFPFSCVLWAIFWSLRQIARYLPHHTSGNASKTHPKSSHDKFKTVSYKLTSLYICRISSSVRFSKSSRRGVTSSPAMSSAPGLIRRCAPPCAV